MELKQVFEKRRSVNFFDTQKTISEDLIRNIYDTAKLAPSSFNLQPWKFILVLNPENKKKLRAASFNQPKVEEASAMLVLLADKEGYQEAEQVIDDQIAKGYITADKKAQYLGMPTQMYGNPAAARAFALRNAGLFAMSFMLAAKDLGVDTHPMDGFDQDKVKLAFKIPERYEVALLIAVGYHDGKKTLLPRLNRKIYGDVLIKEGF